MTTSRASRNVASLQPIISILDPAFGITGDGSDEHVKIQAFFDAAANKRAILPVPPTAYGTGATGIVLKPGSYNIEGFLGPQFTYSGSGTAFDCVAGAAGVDNSIGGTFKGFSVTCTHNSANGFKFGHGTQFVKLEKLQAYGNGLAGQTGTGFLLDGDNADANRFSGNCHIEQCYSLGFLVGLKVTGSPTQPNRTWAGITGINNWWLGSTALKAVAGCRGILYTAYGNGNGSVHIGGTIEDTYAPIEVVSGSIGLTYNGDIEGNTTDPILGVSFNGSVRDTMAYIYEGTTNGAANRWSRDFRKTGIGWFTESYYGRRHNILDGGGVQKWGVTRGDSEIDGGTPDEKFIVSLDSSGANSSTNNYMQLLTHKTAWDSAAPIAGTWGVGDIVWNNAVAVGQPNGWRCTVAGTPGTWVAMANL